MQIPHYFKFRSITPNITLRNGTLIIKTCKNKELKIARQSHLFFQGGTLNNESDSDTEFKALNISTNTNTVKHIELAFIFPRVKNEQG